MLACASTAAYAELGRASRANLDSGSLGRTGRVIAAESMESFDMSHPIDQLDNSRDVTSVAPCQKKCPGRCVERGHRILLRDPPEETRTIILHAEGKHFMAGEFAQSGRLNELVLR